MAQRILRRCYQCGRPLRPVVAMHSRTLKTRSWRCRASFESKHPRWTPTWFSNRAGTAIVIGGSRPQRAFRPYSV